MLKKCSRYQPKSFVMKDIPNPKIKNKIKKRQNTFNLQTKPINKNDSRIKSKQIATKIQSNQKKKPKSQNPNSSQKKSSYIYIHIYVSLQPLENERK